MNRHARASSANMDNKAFREAISRMRVEVLESKAETQRVQDQLNCLVMLVKRAWMGDQAAAMHVANIVGVAPPKFREESESDEATATYKTSAVHHWAMLSIGLLNRHYKQLEHQALAKARSRLQRRQDYLDEQLSSHRDMLRRAAGNRLATLKKNNPYLDQQSEGVKHLKTGSNRPQSSPIHRSTYGSTTHANVNEDMAANNLIQYMASATLNDFQTNLTQNRRGSGSAKYVQPGLFDTSKVVSDKPKKPRPTSAHLHHSDAKRAQPKSAIVIKGDRPLKYETTRPISAKLSSTTAKPNTKPPRAKSAKVQSSTAASRLKTAYQDGYSLLDPHVGSSEGQRSYGMTFVTEEQDSVQAFTQDVRQMQTMEDDFKRTTKMLQQKLGIPGEGTI
ncbi:uncharacterized protein [Amphiura filiformis]|uniref:uncharacterized protein n=1 Tax=Amphiura filiformis TaxID=82378 RepID=UPI003B210AD4